MKVTYEIEMDNGKSIFCTRSGEPNSKIIKSLETRNLPLIEGQCFKGNGYTCTIRIIEK